MKQLAASFGDAPAFAAPQMHSEQMTLASPRTAERADQAQVRRRARAATAFVLERLARSAVAFDNDWTAAIVFATVTQANVGHIDDDPSLAHRWSALDAPPLDDLRRPMSANAAAIALGMPAETVRRKVIWLAARQQLKALKGGYIASAEAFQSEALMTVAGGDLAAAAAYFQAAAELGLISQTDTKTALAGTLLPRAVVRAANNFSLGVLEAMRGPFGDVMTAVFFHGLLNAGGRWCLDLPAKPSPSPRWAPTGAPTKATPALTLGSYLGQPRETARRRISEMTKAGLICATPRGFVVEGEVLMQPAVQDSMARIERMHGDFLERLVLAGVLSPLQAG